MTVYLATCSEKPGGTADDRFLCDALIKLGVETHFKIWTDTCVDWGNADCVLIRSTWDYHHRLPEFVEWARSVERVTKLRNPLDVLQTNSSKKYLLELERKGLPIIPSVIESEPSRAKEVILEMLQMHNEVIIKPTVSATAELTYRLNDISNVDDLIERILDRSEVLIQGFISSITEIGELSLIFFNCNEGQSRFSHAVQKCPQTEDFRVQSDFGGMASPIEPSQEIIKVARQSLETLSDPPLYARVDIVDWISEPKIGELELIEPELFFRFSNHAAVTLAEALVHREI